MVETQASKPGEGSLVQMLRRPGLDTSFGLLDQRLLSMTK